MHMPGAAGGVERLRPHQLPIPVDQTSVYPNADPVVPKHRKSRDTWKISFVHPPFLVSFNYRCGDGDSGDSHVHITS